MKKKNLDYKIEDDINFFKLFNFIAKVDNSKVVF